MFIFFFSFDLVLFNKNVRTQSSNETTYLSVSDLSFYLFHSSFNKYIVLWEHETIWHNRNDPDTDREKPCLFVNQNKFNTIHQWVIVNLIQLKKKKAHTFPLPNFIFISFSDSTDQQNAQAILNVIVKI